MRLIESSLLDPGSCSDVSTSFRTQQARVFQLGERILAIASGGGHWVELQRLTPAFDDLDVVYASVYSEYADDVPGRRFYFFRDVSRRDRFGFIVLVIQLMRLLLIERPKIVITTGSLPCCIALILAKYLFGARTMWIDSIANVQQLSSSGKLAGKFVDVWLTQWPGLERDGGPHYWGAVL
jgi:UDP-N-acetylglucosamine:LPS N-acetylglucosamine transferase